MACIDLHLHSNYSDDGEYTPKELIEVCLREGIHTAAIADHNTTRGISEAKKYAESNNITLIPAVELDCTFCEVNLHVLGYWIDETFDGFAKVEEMILVQEQKAAQMRLDLVEDLGIYVDSASVLHNSKQGNVTGEMIAEAALAEPKNEGNQLLAPYREGGLRSDNPFVNFYWDYCAQGKPAYVPINFISLSEAVKLIRQAGGIPVLAHPGNNIGQDVGLLHEIIKEGVVGIEAFSSYHSPEQTAFYLGKASEFNVSVSCGSDFHGKTKPQIRMGCVDCGGMERELLADLLKNKVKRTNQG